jgi:peptidoglycan hydrolase-like protein with peptidoglycan-binding domain
MTKADVLFQAVPPRIMVVNPRKHQTKERPMKKFLTTLTLGVMLVTPLIATAAGADNPRGTLPAAVDQLLAQDMIQQAQTTLKSAGFNPGRTDGVFDAQTATAVRQYQAANGIPVSGLLDEPTRRVLFPGSEDAGEG